MHLLLCLTVSCVYGLILCLVFQTFPQLIAHGIRSGVSADHKQFVIHGTANH